MIEKKRILFRLLVLPFVFALLAPYTLKRWMFANSYDTYYYLIVSTFMSFGLIPIFYKLGLLLDITDQPGGRHSHLRITPRTGGIAIYITFITVLNLISDPPKELQGLFWSSSLIALIGILDDTHRIGAGIKLLIQIIASIILISHGVFLSFLPPNIYGNAFAYVLTCIWVIGITNAFNFLDGIDGLSSGIAIIVLIFYAVISHSIQDTYMPLVCIIFIGSILGFFPYNFRLKKNALIFLGDAGSTFIGFTIAAISIYGNWGINKSVDLAIPILLLAVPITDMTMVTVIRTFKRKVRSFSELIRYTGSDHFHHRLLHMGLSQRISVIVIFLLTVIMGLLSLLLSRGEIHESIAALSIALIIFYLIVAFMIYKEKRSEAPRQGGVSK